ncbi:MAG: hypothetical protein NXI13_03955 [Proteobacteria bacterium]|nr:hypothetical protein [Pseudomonadota bacterium]
MPLPDRKLAAILSADVVGYSRLMGEDEGRTLAGLRELRQQTFEPVINEKRGTVVKRMGDGWLVEFASVVDAVNCAISVQEALLDHPFIKLRIGIHVGDIVHEDEDIYGDGVNIASRLQEKADPGGIALSAFAHDSLDGVVRQGFQSLGQANLKNISQKIEIFGWGTAIPKTPAPAPARERPAMLVLPFTVSGGTPDTELLAEGMTDAVITAFSRFSWFLTLPRNTSRQFKGQAVNLTSLRRDHQVSYMLESNIRVAGSRARVSAELLDTRSGNSIWAGRFDGSVEDPFELEDQITRAILAELTPRIVGAETRRVQSGGDGSAWDLMIQGRALVCRVNREDNAKAQEILHEAIKLDPESGYGQSDLAFSYLYECLFGWSDDQQTSIRKAVAASDAAIAADEMDAYAYAAAAAARCAASESSHAIALARRAIQLNENLAAGQAMLALALFQTAEYDEALEAATVARNLSPRDPLRAIITGVKGIVFLMLGKFDEMVRNAEDIIQEFPGMPTGWRQLAAAYAEVGRIDDAKEVVENQILRLIPDHTATESGRQLPFGHNMIARQRWMEALIKAGLPE